MFASILIYLFAIIIFLFFQEQCIKEIEDLSNDGEPIVENHCETLILAIITTFNEGLRNGGGIGDYLIPLSQHHDQVNHGFMNFFIRPRRPDYVKIFSLANVKVQFGKRNLTRAMSHFIHHAFPLTHLKREKSTSTENSHSNSSKRFVKYLHARETNFTTRENRYFYYFLFIYLFFN